MFKISMERSKKESTRIKKNENLKKYFKSRKEKDLHFFYGKIKKISNKYFTFNHVIDNDNIIIITGNVINVKGSYCLVVDNNKVVYLKDWQIRPVRNWNEGINAYAVKLNRNFFKKYTFKNSIDDFYIEKEYSFDDLKEIAKTQTIKIAEGHF